MGLGRHLVHGVDDRRARLGHGDRDSVQDAVVRSRATTRGASTSAARSRAATSARAGSRAIATPIPARRASSSGSTGSSKASGLDVVPSLSVSERRPFDGTAATTDTEPSLDVFYKLTPSLTSALTINTDFSATEVDDRQVNLTRFGLFFPEKRDFFLQDADIFEFGGLEENGRPFFSRRIGLSDDGEPIDLEVGGKLTGRVGRWNIGVLSVRQDEFETRAGRQRDGRARFGESARGIERRHDRDGRQPGLDRRQLARRRRLPVPQQPAAGRQARRGQRVGAGERQRGRDRRRRRVRHSLRRCRTTPVGAAASATRSSARVSIPASGS